MTTARVSAGVPAGGQFATNGYAEADVALPPPGSQAPRVPTDQETLDSIAVMMAHSQDWDADLTDDIARSGRPHPGDVLNEDEIDLIEDRGEDVNGAAALKYESKMLAQRTEAAAAPTRVDPTDTSIREEAGRAVAAAAARMNRATALEAELNEGKLGSDPSVRAGYRAQIARMRERSDQQYLRDLETALGIGPAR